ncbi:hypothetical protein ABIA39_007461 [Nocardia sp. GAS34]
MTVEDWHDVQLTSKNSDFSVSGRRLTQPLDVAT